MGTFQAAARCRCRMSHSSVLGWWMSSRPALGSAAATRTPAARPVHTLLFMQTSRHCGFGCGCGCGCGSDQHHHTVHVDVYDIEWAVHDFSTVAALCTAHRRHCQAPASLLCIASLHHHITTSSHHHITTSPHHHIIHHHITTTLPHRYVTDVVTCRGLAV